MREEQNICVYCNQEFRRKPGLFMLKNIKVLYCSPQCSQRAQRHRAKNKSIDYTCRTCGSFVRGTAFTKIRKHCTDSCRKRYGKGNNTVTIKIPVEVIKLSDALL